MTENFAAIIGKFGDLYWQGLLLTLQLSALSLLGGFFLAWFLALVLWGGGRMLKLPVRVFIYFMTGTPLLVQLFLVYYGLAQFEAVRESIFWKLLREPYWCALLVFSLNTAAYSARIFYGAMCETDRGEWEAALAFGLPPHKRLMRIVIPDAWRRALPAFGNEMIFFDARLVGGEYHNFIGFDRRGKNRGTRHFSFQRIVFVGDSVVYDVKRRHHSCNPPNGKILPPPLANGKLIKMDSRSCGNDKKMRAHCLFYAESHSIDKSNAPHIKLGRSRNT